VWLPPVVEFSGLAFPISGVFWGIGFLFAMGLGLIQGWKRGFQTSDLIKISLVGFLGALIGGRLGHVHQYWEYFSLHPIEALYIHEGGMMYLAGLYGGLLSGSLYCWNHDRLVEILDLAAPSICLGHVFGRSGCFFYGCCFGKEVGFDSGFPGVIFPGEELLRHPTQLYSALALGLLFFFLLWISSRVKRPGAVILSYLGFYSAFRFLIEFLRDDERGFLLGIEFFSSSQTLSLATLLILAIYLPFWRRRTSP
jgi:phosphatidylglycerol---prolipoprotein diacylglyceryl transferase